MEFWRNRDIFVRKVYDKVTEDGSVFSTVFDRGPALNVAAI